MQRFPFICQPSAIWQDGSCLPTVHADIPRPCVLTLSYGEQVAEIVGVSLGGWRLEALNLTQHEVVVSGQV